jgi:glycosyltransferase involved in cell wall biosynthesis
MEICIVDHGAPLPAKNYGGTERVIWGLGKSLSKMGHKVTFLVPEGSTCDFADIIVLDKSIDINKQIPDYIDLVHLNFFPLQPVIKPYLITCHGNVPNKGELDPNVVFISKNHAYRYNGDSYVYNGLYWEDYPEPDLEAERKGYHFLGKASWKVKNLRGAVKIANVQGEKLSVIGGKKWTARNFKRAPADLFNSRITYYGMLGDVEKSRILKNSKGLIFPVNWNEPFGLAIIESLFAGCAVFGTPNGSLPELITPKTGFLGRTVKEIANAIENFEYDPLYCHRYAIENFHSDRMANDYLQLYTKVLNGEKLNKRPIFQPDKDKVDYIL